MHPDDSPHSYEEIRQVVVDVLTKREWVQYAPEQWISLVRSVEDVFARRKAPSRGRTLYEGSNKLHPDDAELVRDVFWDLFRQGVITLGLNESNPAWPWFRLSHFGEKILKANDTYRFHDVTSYTSLVRDQAGDIASETMQYLEEAVAAFYADCRLSTCVMLGVAAEAEFLRVLEVAGNSSRYAAKFTSLNGDVFIGTKIKKFQKNLDSIVPELEPKKDFENLHTNLNFIQLVLRSARNDAGHPNGAKAPTREQVFINLQLFIPFAYQLMKLREALV
ncbi:hypothetical protein DES32_2858 [Methylovirgula ligni]|uniref:Abortive infection Abi-like protein n=1 Tax=Methylovirgula ligni TaxID=569860 RepID=A0A3D9YQC8_9HYPH|nr:hypothetical protein [Methylovirgula ligni]REF84744.1 hypothetical protein DES32_2858 [Methylovirgula ligni]